MRFPKRVKDHRTACSECGTIRQEKPGYVRQWCEECQKATLTGYRIQVVIPATVDRARYIANGDGARWFYDLRANGYASSIELDTRTEAEVFADYAAAEAHTRELNKGV